MALNNTILDIGGNAMAPAMTHISLHSGDPGAAGTSNVTSAARVATGWTGSSSTNGGDLTLSNKAFTGGGNGTACTYVGFWSAATGGTFYGSVALTGDQTFNSAGEYTITTLTITGTST